MTDYKPIMTQETDFYMRASSWRKLISICFNIISYVFWRWSSVRRMSCTFERNSWLWIFFFKSEAEPQKKFNQKVFLWLRQEPFLTMIDGTQPNSLSVIVFLNY